MYQVMISSRDSVKLTCALCRYVNNQESGGGHF